MCLIDCPGLVDFAIRLVNSVWGTNGKVKFFGKFNLHKNCNQTCWSKNFFRTTLNDFWSSTATYSLPDWQAITLTFFAPYSGHVGNKTRLETTCNVWAVLWSIFSYHLWLSLKAWLLLTKQIHPCHWLKNIFLMYSPGLKLTITFLSLTGLLIFRAVAEPWNSGISAKSCKIHKNTKNTAKFGRNLIKYMSVQHIWNLFQL